jgi:hypothetical protein
MTTDEPMVHYTYPITTVVPHEREFVLILYRMISGTLLSAGILAACVYIIMLGHGIAGTILAIAYLLASVISKDIERLRK